MLKEDLIKSIDSLVEDFFAKSEDDKEIIEEKKEEAVVAEEGIAKSDEISDAKATGTDISLAANGGEDVIKNKEEKEKSLEKLKEGDEDEEKKKEKAKKSIEVDVTSDSQLLKSFGDMVDLVKSLKNDIEDLKKQPAREPKSLRGYQALNKSEGVEDKKSFKKSEVLEVMNDLQKSNQCSAENIIEYEITNNISDSVVKEAVKQALESKKV